MAWPTWTPPYLPSQSGTQVQDKPNIIENTFGDGYVQRILNGINFMSGTCTLTWGQIRNTDWQTIVTFMQGQLVTPFLWQLPDESSPRQWVAASWTKAYGTSTWVQNAQLTLKQDFTPPPT